MRRKSIWTLAFLAIAITAGWSQAGGGRQPAHTGEQNQTAATPDQTSEQQTDNGQQPADSGEQTQSAPMPGQDIEPKSENGQQADNSSEAGQTAPISTQQIESQTKASNPMWVTEPSPYELAPNQRSFMTVGLTLSESGQFIPANGQSNPFQAYSATRLYASVDLVKIIRRYTTSISYRGGGFFYRNSGSPWSEYEIQQLTASENISWQRTNLVIEDSLSDFPGASFGSSAYGGASAYNLGGTTSSTSDFFGFNQFGGLGQANHLTNVALAQVTQELTPRTGITFAGAYAQTSYFGNYLINSRQFSALAGYNYELTPRSQISLAYGYQGFRFPGGSATDANSVQLLYEHTLSSRMSLGLGGGPQFITSHTPTVIVIGPFQIPITLTSHQTGVIAFATLNYALRSGSLNVYYEHLLTSGSGLFAGATSDITAFSLSRPILPAWTTNFAAGFVRLGSVGNKSAGILGTAFEYGYASVGVSRKFGRNITLSASYQFNDQTQASGCSASSGCGSIVHTALISVSWHTLPIRLDRGSDVKGDAVTVENPQSDLPNPAPDAETPAPPPPD